jgi:hypothetical protein
MREKKSGLGENIAPPSPTKTKFSGQFLTLFGELGKKENS